MENHVVAQCPPMTSYFEIDTLIGLQMNFRNIFENPSKYTGYGTMNQRWRQPAHNDLQS